MSCHNKCNIFGLVNMLLILILLLGLLVNVHGQGVSSLDSKLSCDPGWFGFQCNRRHCPSGVAWNPGDKGSVQPDTFYATCSNAGYCDTRSGECKCFKGFTGASCERSFCPGHCSGHGSCVPLSDFEFEDVAYLNLMSLNHLPHDIRGVFHRAKNRVCQCDPEWTGPDCRERLCPYGDDPRTDVTTMKKGTQNSEKDEIQQISLAANGPIFGSMLLEFETYHRQKYHTIPLFFPSRLYSDTLSFSGSVVRDPWRQLNIFEVGDFLTFSNTVSNNDKRCLVQSIESASSLTCEGVTFVDENIEQNSSLKTMSYLDFFAATRDKTSVNSVDNIFDHSNSLDSFVEGDIITIKGSKRNDGFYTVMAGSNSNRMYVSPKLKNEKTFYNVSKTSELYFNSSDNSLSYDVTAIDGVTKFGDNMLGKLKIFKGGDRIRIMHTQHNDGIYVV